MVAVAESQDDTGTSAIRQPSGPLGLFRLRIVEAMQGNLSYPEHRGSCAALTRLHSVWWKGRAYLLGQNWGPLGKRGVIALKVIHRQRFSPLHPHPLPQHRSEVRV